MNAAEEHLAYCAQALRRGDEDRWLAVQYAPARVRSRLVALYALRLEVDRAPAMASEAALGEIRLQWWREAIEGAADGGEGAHPALSAARAAGIADPALARAFDAAIDARTRLLYPAPFSSVDALADWLGEAEGGLAVEAARRAGRLGECGEAAVRDAAVAYGLARSGPTLAPQLAGKIAAQARALHAGAGKRLRGLDPAVLPAALHAALTPLYLRDRPPSALARRWRLFRAMTTGRL